MYTKVTKESFIKAFKDIRPSNFTDEGLGVLFDYLEGLEDDTDSKIELDVIALCCEYSEGTYNTVKDTHDVELIKYEEEGEEVWKDRVFNYFNEYTIALKVGTDRLIIQNY